MPTDLQQRVLCFEAPTTVRRRRPPSIGAISPVGLGAKTRLLRHFILQMIILPRQARDKHKGKLKKRCTILQTGKQVWCGSSGLA
jgi:hypothetical protein